MVDDVSRATRRGSTTGDTLTLWLKVGFEAVACVVTAVACVATAVVLVALRLVSK